MSAAGSGAGAAERLPAAVAVACEEAAPAVVRSLFTLLQQRRLRGPMDPRVQDQVAALRCALQESIDSEGWVRFHRHGPHLFVNRTRVRPLPEVRLAVRALWQDLERLGLGGFELEGTLDPEQLDLFLELYPKLDRWLAAHGESAEGSSEKPALRTVREIIPGIRLLPFRPDQGEISVLEEDPRAQARRTFFRALAGARVVVRQLAAQRIPELRKSRAIVHELIDTLVEEEFSLLGMAAIQDFDPYTFQHSVHVSILSMALGQGLGLPRRDLADLGVSALFHDIGKVQVPKTVLRKPAQFDPQDWSVMRTHPLAGARELLRFGGASELAVKVMLVSAEHHMRFDGSGYPRLGDGWQQGLFARIVSLADCYDAMTASRAYMKRPFTPDAVIRYMLENAGRMFDPDLLRLFVGKIGLYPVGSLVRLESGELALVMEPPASPREVERPRIRPLQRTKTDWEPGDERELGAGPSGDPRCRIQAGCHPLDHGVDVDILLSRLYLDPPASATAVS